MRAVSTRGAFRLNGV